MPLQQPEPEASLAGVPRALGTSEYSRAAAAKPRPTTPPPRRPRCGAPPLDAPSPPGRGGARSWGRGLQLGPGLREAPGSSGDLSEIEGGRLCLPPSLQGLKETKMTFVIPWPLGKMVSSGPS